MMALVLPQDVQFLYLATSVQTLFVDCSILPLSVQGKKKFVLFLEFFVGGEGRGGAGSDTILCVC